LVFFPPDIQWCVAPGEQRRMIAAAQANAGDE
jgi:hypothetical protein